ncbi:PPOX class F420-dependent oxidoreductase [Streptomyces sp. ZG43]|uniref:PPOX class F420-dependent oxidoreductase n=1 Tax=Streptomyces sp. 604F TaxID=1476754 RepID=UPI001397A853|nr:PPOX class F420-dependent oxidoreductase [Streptomyces sp. 604F]MBP3079978.1 F420-dependent oxidoreductase [Streptomyces sp. 604F]QHV85013.1 PPOX class F420-dependent oxidoreductase [Streptomyces sp. 604F]
MPQNDAHDRTLSLLDDISRGVLVTLKKDGRPQLSNVDFTYDPEKGVIRFSTTDGRAKVRNLRRDPRISLHVTTANGGAYAVFEGTATLSGVAAAPDDEAVEELVDVYRAVQGEHPDWDEYRTVMVEDGRLVVRFAIDHSYGWVPGA